MRGLSVPSATVFSSPHDGSPLMTTATMPETTTASSRNGERMRTAPSPAAGPREFEAYTRWSLYGFLVLLGLVTCQEVLKGPATVGADLAARWAVVALIGAHVAVAVAACAGALAGRPGRGTARISMLLGLASALGVVLVSDPQVVLSEGAGAFWPAPALVATTFVVRGVDPARRRVVPAILAMGPALAVAFALRGMTWQGALVFGLWAPLLAAVGVATGHFTWWMIEVVRTLVRSRAAHARLAVAEERLRFARDLHDVYGRTLSAIALKSELGAEFARRGDARAVAEMEAVHDMAHEALAQVRGIVRGYREIDPLAEVAGARSVLGAAGARLEVEGLETALAALDTSGRTACAWVLREASTNVLPHSEAAVVTVRAGVEGERVVLTVDNDGVAPPGGGGADHGHDGTGLLGLAERLRQVGGTLRHERHGHRFVLTATIPLRSAPAADDASAASPASAASDAGAEADVTDDAPDVTDSVRAPGARRRG